MHRPDLPSCESDFETLRALDLAPHLKCIICKRPFSSLNVFTSAGWRETQITGFCEACFDEATAEDE